MCRLLEAVVSAAFFKPENKNGGLKQNQLYSGTIEIMCYKLLEIYLSVTSMTLKYNLFNPGDNGCLWILEMCNFSGWKNLNDMAYSKQMESGQGHAKMYLHLNVSKNKIYSW